MWNAESIYEIPISFFKDNGIEAVIFDLDNTLDPPLTKEASKRTIEKIEELKKNGLFVAIVSNNTKKRIERYVTNLNIDGYVYDARKPSPKKLRSFIEERKLDKNKTVMVGDQLFTDKQVAEKCQIKFILTSRLSNKEMPWTYFNRIREMFVRKKLMRKGKLGNSIKKEE